MIIFLFRGFVGDGFILPVAGINQSINQRPNFCLNKKNLNFFPGLIMKNSTLPVFLAKTTLQVVFII